MKRDDTHNNGFTLMETLVAVAIVVILMAVAFIGVMNYQRSMKQLELDRTAQELFIAAQNHLTMAESQGVLANKAMITDINIVGEKAEREEADGTKNTYHYFYVNATSRDSLLQSGTVLYDMLPQFSIDETVRTGGSYVIEYDLDSATVTNVFYSDQSSRFSEVQFEAVDFKELFESPGYVGSVKSEERLKGFKKGEEQSSRIIGWYGGDNVKGLQRTKLYAPRVTIKNAECLEVEVSFTATDLSRMISNMGSDALVQVTISSASRDKTTHIINPGETTLGDTVSTFMGGGSRVEGKTVRRYITYVLDDVTRSGGHFAEQHWCTDSDENKQPLIPGEDIKVQAVVFSNSTLANIAPSSFTEPENSLFAKMIVDNDSQIGAIHKKVACVSNIRHLENLDPSISGYQLNSLGENGAVKAQQTADLYWKAGGPVTSNSFQDAIYKNEARAKPDSETSAAKVQVYPLHSISRYIPAGAESDGTFLPVNTAASVSDIYALQYDGMGHSLTKIYVNTNEPAGVFGTLTSVANEKPSVKNLKLIDCNVNSSGTGSEKGAGALAGVAKNGTSITNVLSYGPIGDVRSSASGGIVGGLIGVAEGGASNPVTIESCAAAVLVGATGENSIAGGLVGKAGEHVTINHSYAGGHTEKGMYSTENFNVAAKGTAGGLVGTSAGTAISNSYSTCSASGLTAGGLVGSATYGGSIANCYCTGLIEARAEANAKIGAFAGTSDIAPTDCYYYQIINYRDDGSDLAPISGKTVNDIKAIDESVQKYQAYFDGIEFVEGIPYDTELTKLYAGKYPFKAITHLDKNYTEGTEGATKRDYFVTKHYGDWPAPETLVVNVPNS